VDIQYIDQNGNNVELKETLAKTVFCKLEEEPQQEDIEIIKHKERLILAHAQERAETFIIAGDYISAQKAIKDCSYTITTTELKDLADTIYSSYSSNNHSISRGLTNSVKNTLKGRRVAQTSNIASNYCFSAGAQSYSGMDAMEKLFSVDDHTEEKEEEKEDNIKIDNSTPVLPSIIKTKTKANW
jgi:hypothetical protein